MASCICEPCLGPLLRYTNSKWRSFRSTSEQLPGTLSRFFASHTEVVLLKMDYARLSGFKPVKWEATSTGQMFPHLYGYGIEGENVESFTEVVREGEGEKTQSWEDKLEQLRREGWLEK